MLLAVNGVTAVVFALRSLFTSGFLLQRELTLRPIFLRNRVPDIN
jgi:hypothetical protein